MTQSTRKLIGTLAMIGLVPVYIVAIGAIYANLLGSAPWWILITFFAVAGLLWFFPAAWLIRWMSRPGA